MSSDPEANIESRLCAYIDGLLDAEQREFIEQYLDRYPEHRQLIDQLMQERALLRDLPREAAPPDVLAHFQGQLERSVLLNDLDTDSGRTGSGRRRWNLAALLAFLLLAAGVSVIVWIAMPPQRPGQSAAPAMTPEPAATLPVDTTLPIDTTQGSTTIPSSEPAVAVVVDHPHAQLLEVSGADSLIVMISSSNLPAAEKRVDAFLKSRSLTHPGKFIDKDMPAPTQPSGSTGEGWDIPGMTRTQAKELVQSFSTIPTTAASATEPSTQPASSQPAATTQMFPTTHPATLPTVGVMIIFQNADFPAIMPGKAGS